LTTNDHRDLIAVGRIARPVGVRGEVKVNLLTDDPHRLDGEGEVFIGTQEVDAERFSIERIRMMNGSWVAAFAGVETRDAAEQLRDRYVFVPERDAPKAKTGAYRVDDIIGCTVVTTEGRSVGTVGDVLALPANDVWIVRQGDREYMVPAVRAIIRVVDVPGKRIVVTALEGLFE
jgi:16S rRNA processing protein RimM